MSSVTNKEAILNLATTKQIETIRTVFNKEDLAEMRESVTDILIKVNTKEDELQEIKDNYKAEIQPLKKQNKRLLTDIKAGYRDEEKLCLLVPDFDKKIMELYDDEGSRLGERKMLISEMQGNLDFKK